MVLVLTEVSYLGYKEWLKRKHTLTEEKGKTKTDSPKPSCKLPPVLTSKPSEEAVSASDAAQGQTDGQEDPILFQINFIPSQ